MRLFVAVNFPPDTRDEIWTATESLRERGLPVRWVHRDALHLTMKFLGEVDPAQVDGLVRAVDAAAGRSRPFSLPVGGFGAFPSVERPNVIWVGCEGVPALELLQHDVESGAERLGFPVEGRPFRPHLTIGRVKKDARRGDFRALSPALEQLQLETEFLVRSIELMESKLGPNGSRYTALHSAPFPG